MIVHRNDIRYRVLALVAGIALLSGSCTAAQPATPTVTPVPAATLLAAPAAASDTGQPAGSTTTTAPATTTAGTAVPATAMAQSPTAIPTATAPAAATTTAAAASQDKTKTVRPASWDEQTHGDDADPNYSLVFPQDKVNQITITIEPEDWGAMQANMTALLGEPGTRGGPGGRGGMPGGGQFPALPPGQRPEQEQGALPGAQPAEGQPQGGIRGGAGGFRGGNPDMTPENPMWVPATVTFAGQTWTQVGVRYKGNSSLLSSWNSRSAKLPLKLDFDTFEDEHPEIKNQRFHGFNQLSLGNNFSDRSFMRDAVTYDILEAAGLVTPETAFYEVFLDHGEGPVSLGLYTMVEVVDDTVVEKHFEDPDGNVYEADGPAASLAKSTYDQIQGSFQKENNEDAADWSDIQTLHKVLHSEQRTADPAGWRAALEKVFDVDGFLKWLALTAVIQDWDTYGAMTHNFYLYDDPTTGQLVWISWDHNMALSAGGGPGGRGGNTSLDQKNVGDNWPLIRFLLDDPTYYAQYVKYVGESIRGPFNADKMAQKYQSLASLLAPYANKESSDQAFTAAVQQLVTHAQQRTEAVETFMSIQK